MKYCGVIVFFFLNDTATTEIYTLPLHDALPIYRTSPRVPCRCCPTRPPTCSSRPSAKPRRWCCPRRTAAAITPDRKSTRLNSSHANISYAVFCLKKKKKHYHISIQR